MSNEISIIIPVYNELNNIHMLIKTLNDFMHMSTNIKFEIIFVDDGSTDGTIEVIRKSKIKSFSAKIIKLSKNFGSHAALRAGILNSSGNNTVFMYADLQDPVDLILNLYDKIEEGNDIVWAERRNTKSGIIEKIFSRLYAKMMQVFVIKTFPQMGFDIVMFNKKVKDELNQNIELNSSIFMQIILMGFKQDRIIYDKQLRKFGKSKWVLAKRIKLFIDSFIAFSYFPIRLITMVGFLLSLISIIWVIYIVGRAIILDDLNQGWPTLIAVLLFGFGVTNTSLGIIAEYLWRTLDSSRKRKAFIIDEIYDISDNRHK